MVEGILNLWAYVFSPFFFLYTSFYNFYMYSAVLIYFVLFTAIFSVSSAFFQDHPKPDFDRCAGSHHHLHHHDGYLFFCQGTLISLFFTKQQETACSE